MIDYCDCRYPSGSSHHENCLNSECGKKIKSIHELYEEVLDDIKAKDARIKELETLVCELRDDHFKEVHWSNTVIGNKYRKIFEGLETKDKE